MKNFLLSCGLALAAFCCCSGNPAEPDIPDGPDPVPDKKVRNTVFVVFKTHLDVGFTDMPSEIERRYAEQDVLDALKVIDELRVKDGPACRYKWTIGSWALDECLKKASPEISALIEKAIRNGDIVWNAMPYTMETEMTTAEMLDAMLGLSASLDDRFGKKTVSAKMSDVPGHTRSMIPSLSRAGIRLVHISQNRSTTLPEIPYSDWQGVCRWAHPDGGEVILLDRKPYSHEIELPGGNILSVNLKQDNKGPHTADEVRKIYKNLRTAYPGKTVRASDLNEVADVLEDYRDCLPLFTGEIGDTWIHGFASAPPRMSAVRALNRKFREWVNSGRLDPKSDEAVAFAIRLGLVSEHTWGLDSKLYLGHEEPYYYNIETFTAALESGEFKKLEDSWEEIDAYVNQAIALLPADLRAEAVAAVDESAALPDYDPQEPGQQEFLSDDGSFAWKPSTGGSMKAGLFTLQTFGFKDFRAWIKTWMTSTSAKAGMEGSEAVPAMVHPVVRGSEMMESDGRQVRCSMVMSDGVDSRICPQKLLASYRTDDGNRTLDIEFTLIGKPANRMAEAYWLSFVPEDIVSVSIEKMGSMVNVSEVVTGGNARMFGVDRYVEVETLHGKFRIYSYDVPLVLAGGLDDLSYKAVPDISKGIHFNIFNNLWGVNYSMWWKGSHRFRFRIEAV
ncbi:MAG: DUF5054 domain-containing protein [Candidatus Cryptobacteroides sp.]